MKHFRHAISRLLSNYGMLLVLIALAIYYSAVTMTDQQTQGAEAGRLLAKRIPAALPGATVVVISKPTADDDAFASALVTGLTNRNLMVAAVVRGDPHDTRQAFDKLAEAGKPIQMVATTADCAGWTILQDFKTRYPKLGDPQILVPETSRWPTFLTQQNLLNVANQITVVAILAVGMTVVIITGGIDLSVGSLIALSAVLVTVLIRDHGGATTSNVSMVWFSLAGISGCAVVGFFSGLMVAGFKVPSFIATLAVMQVASGIAFIIAQGGSIYEVPDSFTWLGRGLGPAAIPNAVILMLLLYIAAHFMMTATILGRRIYAVGGNPEAARLSGVNVPLVLIFAYTFSGAMAGLAGVVQASQLKSGAPTYGVMYELYAIAAVVVGGTSLTGGEGRIFGTLIGAFIIAVIQNGMNLTGVQSYQQKVVLGVVILGAVLLDLLKKRDWRAALRWAGRKGKN
jgi:ribose transport system permease protein